MLKEKALFVTFEGIEGSGKSYQSKILFKNLLKEKMPVILTREPGGTRSAEKIRNLILEDYFHPELKEKFNKCTDTLLYLAARNEHVTNLIKPALAKKKIVICDRFTDSTLAYQVYGKGVNRNLINSVHKHILKDLMPDLTFILTVNIATAMLRLKKRKKKNRYDKFSRKFYTNVQNAFLKLAKKNKKRYVVIDNSHDSKDVEKVIFETIKERFKR
tara:strand:+ start:448 stop:1095 length:648 start_codon:yes stop_codon:yes gene_type:complete